MRLPPDLTPDALRVDPLPRAETIPSRWYTDDAMGPFEREAVVRPAWQVVGHASQLADAGRTLTATVAGEPVVVVRGADGALRAFYNVCRHRGGPLVTADAGGPCRVLQCQYHGWTYALDGRLRGVPRFDRTDLFDREAYGLVPVGVETWQGLVWVCVAPEAAPPLAETLAGVAERIAPQTLGALQFHSRVTYRVACDWKAYVDNFLEGYHLPLVHPELCKTLDVGAYLTETFARTSLQHSPLRARTDGSIYGDGDAFYWFVFPNVMLNVLPGRLQTNVVLPDGPGRCRVLFDFFYADGATDEAIAADLAFSDAVQQEDVAICEHVQRGLASRGYDRGRFSVDAEAGVHHFQALLKGAFADALTAGLDDPPAGPPGLRPHDDGPAESMASAGRSG